jgi:hypothetical protein
LSVRKAFIAVGGLPPLASLLLEARCAYLPPLLFSAVCERKYAITPTVALKRPVSSRLAGAQLGLECAQVDRHKARDIATRAERRVFGTFREFRATHAKRHERSHEGDVHGMSIQHSGLSVRTSSSFVHSPVAITGQGRKAHPAPDWGKTRFAVSLWYLAILYLFRESSSSVSSASTHYSIQRRLVPTLHVIIAAAAAVSRL